MTSFHGFTTFFKKPLPRAHQPVSESTCSSMRWEVGAGWSVGRSDTHSLGIGAFQVLQCQPSGLQVCPESYPLNAPPPLLRCPGSAPSRPPPTSGCWGFLCLVGQEGCRDSAQTARLLQRLRPLPGPLGAEGGQGAAAGK